MKNYRKIMKGMTLEELREYADADTPKGELDLMSKENLIDLLDDQGIFEETYEMANEGSESMHPNEDDEEFFEHEAPDKD